MPIGTHRLVGAVLVSGAVGAASAALAPVAMANPDARASVTCGFFKSPVTKRTYVVIPKRVGCKRARQVIHTYRAKARRGDCTGNRCFTTADGYKCSTKTAADEIRTGISTTCTKGKARVRTLVVTD